MQQTLLQPDKTLPLVITPEGEAESRREFLLQWIGGEQDSIEDRLQRHGAILFRGFELSRGEHFKAAVEAFQSDLLNYVEGQSQREKVGDQIYNSTYYPPAETITLHNELSYVSQPPRYLFFFCHTAPADGGETPIDDCRAMLQRLPPELVESFRAGGIQYTKNMHGGSGFGKSWQEHFETDDRRTVEAYLEQGHVDFEWRNDGTLRTRQLRPAIIRHPATGEEIWFNQASLWHVSELGAKGQAMQRMVGEQSLPTNAYFGNGDPIDGAALDVVRRTAWDGATFFAWQPGDLLFLDNLLVAHGRNRYAGDRLILVAMA